MKVYKLT